MNSGLVTSVPTEFLCTALPDEPLEALRVILDCDAAFGWSVGGAPAKRWALPSSVRGPAGTSGVSI